MKHIEKIIAIGMLIFAIGFNLWLYRLEPQATVDPNDNSFQYALVDRTNQIWDFAQQKCTGIWLSAVSCQLSALIDHWVPNWAEGYNLPFYYSHVPQIVIVGSYKLVHFFSCQLSAISCQLNLFQYYHWVIYLLLSLFPLSIFLALRVIKLPWLIAGIGALLASHLSTDGLYGLDPSSFLWRGFGLSSQLFGMIWLPIALAWSWRYFERHETRNMKHVKPQSLPSFLSLVPCHLFPATFFLTLTAMGHLGLGMMALLSLVPIAMAKPLIHILDHDPVADIFEVTKKELTKLIALGGVVIFFLSYWIIPIFLSDNYHNFSFWDPPWKFNSYGARETIVRLLNGELFDFGRSAWMTVLVIVGAIGTAWNKLSFPRRRESSPYFKLDPRVKPEDDMTLFPFSLLFLFWLALYFGRGTWGGLIDLIPGMREFHLSRFIVGVHMAGLFLAPIGIWATIERFRFPHRIVRYLCYLGILGLVIPPIYKQTLEYAKHNDRLIKQANENYAKTKSDEDLLFAAIRSLPPGRVFAGRGGSWGKDFRVAETPYYMDLSAYGIPTVLWLPETWSPNSDIEQYFSEDNARDYDLFGIRYIAAPPTQKPQQFWKLLEEGKTWKLYEIELSAVSRQPSAIAKTVGYFTTGVRPAVVAVDKRSYVNAVRLWIQTDQTHAKGLYPELTFAKDYPRTTGLPNFKMIDEVTYVVPDGSTHNLFKEPPWYQNPTNPTNLPIRPIIKNEESEADMIFKAKVEVPDNCMECIVILKQSFHPNWRATIDGKPAQTITVFPFYLAASIPSGTHDVVFSYEPSQLKVWLLALEVATLIGLTVHLLTTRAL